MTYELGLLFARTCFVAAALSGLSQTREPEWLIAVILAIWLGNTASEGESDGT